MAGTSATADERRLRVVGAEGKPSTLIFDSATLRVVREDSKQKVLEAPLRQVLWAEVANGAIEVHVLAHKKKNASAGLTLVNVNGKIHTEDMDSAPTWAEELMMASYLGIKRRRKLRVLINPAGGPGKARGLFMKKVEPILRAARCELDVTYTERRNHAQDIAKDLSLTFDAVVSLSGDGLIHEIFNGFAQHAFPMRAFRIPIAPIPTGSANGTALNLIGIKEGFDVAIAALNVVKGYPMELDLFSMTAGGKRTITYMSQCVGLMADLDLGTEHLRWMGDTRFMYGFIREVMKHKPCPVKVSIKVEERNKDAMVDKFHSAKSALKDAFKEHLELHRHRSNSILSGETADSSVIEQEPELSDEEAAKLPKLKYDHESNHGWVEFDKPMLYVYAGQGPYVGRDLMQFPVSLPNDGLIDVVVQELSSRTDMLKAIDGAEKGAPFWLPMQHYYKAHAYRIAPASPDAKVLLSVDGEAYPFDEFQVEVHRGLGRMLSPEKQYASHFTLRPRASSVSTK